MRVIHILAAIAALSVPSLYAQESKTWGMRSFTDPALTVGGGIRLDVTRRFYVRPDVRALVVFGDGDRLTLTTMTLALGYRF